MPFVLERSDLFAQGREAARVDIFIVAVVKRADQGLDDRFGRMRIWLADAEIHDFDAPGFELISYPAKGDDGGLAERLREGRELRRHAVAIEIRMSLAMLFPSKGECQ